MKNYADEIIKILNKSYYIYNTFCFCVSGFQKKNLNGLKTVFFTCFFFFTKQQNWILKITKQVNSQEIKA